MLTIRLWWSVLTLLFVPSSKLMIFTKEARAQNSICPSQKVSGLACGLSILTPPVDLDWTSVKIKVLGIYIGPGDLASDNWLPRISAVANVLSS